MSLHPGVLASVEPGSETPAPVEPGSAPPPAAVDASSGTLTPVQPAEEAAPRTRPLPNDVVTIQPPNEQTATGDRYLLRAVALGVLVAALVLLALAVAPRRWARSRSSLRPGNRAMLAATGLGGVIGVLIGLLGGTGL